MLLLTFLFVFLMEKGGFQIFYMNVMLIQEEIYRLDD